MRRQIAERVSPSRSALALKPPARTTATKVLMSSGLVILLLSLVQHSDSVNPLTKARALWVRWIYEYVCNISETQDEA